MTSVSVASFALGLTVVQHAFVHALRVVSVPPFAVALAGVAASHVVRVATHAFTIVLNTSRLAKCTHTTQIT